MALIPLNGRRAAGQCATVDDCDVEWMSQWNWYLGKIGYVYGRHKNGGKKLLMHRLVMATPQGMVTDHISGNRLDNRRENLRICTESQNKANRGAQKNNRHGYRGVSREKKTNTWDWAVQLNGKRLRGWGYTTPEAAAKDRDEAAKQLHGEFAVLNFERGNNDNGAYQIPDNLPQIEKSQYVGELPAGARAISLSRGKFVMVDEQDYSWLNQRNWWFGPAGALAQEKETGKTILMHRLIASTPVDMVCDHINGNNLDNRHSNLRNCQPLDNSRNSAKRSHSKQPYKGICRNHNRWGARIRVNGKQVYLGTFPTPELAAQAYDDAARHHFGAFARLNFPSQTNTLAPSSNK